MCITLNTVSAAEQLSLPGRYVRELLWTSAGSGSELTGCSDETSRSEVCLVSNPQKDFQRPGAFVC